MNARNMSMSVATAVALVMSGSGVTNADTLDQLSVQFLQGNAGGKVITAKPERDIRIDIWTDVEEESLMQRGEEFTLSFQTNSDLYVVIYKIDVEGRAEVVWPSSRYSDGFVYGNHAYSIPRPGQPGRLRVGNVKGVEYVEAIASSYPFDLRALGIDFRFDSDDRSLHDYYIDGDPFLAVNDINYAITGLEEDVDYVVTDWLHLYVEEQVEYARYSCNQCHLDDSGYSTVTPYVDTCTQVQVRVDWGWYNSWYVSFGWYPLYYEPPFYYWDYYWSRPYWYAWYPVPYRWPGYSVYARGYPVYWWRDSGYYYGDYASHYSNRRTRSVPLYDVERTRSRSSTVTGRDGTSRTVMDRPVSARNTDTTNGRRVDRDTLARNTRPPRQLDRPASSTGRGRTVDTGAIRDPGGTQRGSIRTDRGARERIVSQRPAGSASNGREGVSPSSGDNGRRWTRPRVQNENPSGRSGSGRTGVQGSRGRPDRTPAVDRSNRGRSSTPRSGSKVDRPSSNRSRSGSPPPRQKVDRGKSRSSSGGKSSVAPQRSSPRSSPQPRSQPAPRSRGGGSGSSRGRGGGGRG